ncbi:MAG: fumarate hydratase C-terminal domain-containing protein [Anaerolineae bacterium]
MPSALDQLRRHNFQTPIRPEDTAKLEMGDVVYLTGTLFTGREGFYKRHLDEGVPLPEGVDISQFNVNFHSSPAVEEVRPPDPESNFPGEYRISATTGTASFRFAKWMPKLLSETGVKCIVGKSGLSSEVYKAHFVPNGATYLLLMGYGLGAMYGQAIKRVRQVVWREELGLAQAMWVLDIENFGPLIVDCDKEGNSLFEKLNKQVDEKLAKVFEGLPEPTLKRYGELTRFEDEVLS